MFEIPGRIDEATKLVEPINVRLKDVAEQFSKVSQRRESLASDASAVKAADFLQECEKSDIAELVAHQKELAALTDASNVLPTCLKFFESDIAAAESALTKAVKAVDAQLRKAGFSPENQPGYAANVPAAIHRFEMMVRDAESVRSTQAALNEANENLTAFRRMVDEVPNIVARKCSAIEAWARKRIFR